MNEAPNLTSNYEALVSALRLAITADTDDQFERAVGLAEYFSAGLTENEVERAKAEAGEDGRTNEITVQDMEQWGHYATWSIHADTSDEDIGSWVLENRVGTECINADLTDGLYRVRLDDFTRLAWGAPPKKVTMKNKVLIRKGRVDIASVLETVDEYIERTGDSDHKFVELLFGNGDGTLNIHLGS
tara:strand:+ start:936 stop:1496 length:561 start_codon:yes stop_codon:yes gene_type:complete